MQTKLTRLLATALATALLSGCVTTAPQKKTDTGASPAASQRDFAAEKVAKTAAIDKATLSKQNPKLPPGVVDITDLTSSLWEHLSAKWVAGGKNEDEVFERAFRVYPDIRQDYNLRVTSGLTPISAQAALMPLVYAHIDESVLPGNVRLGQIIQPRMYDPQKYVNDYYRDQEQELMMPGSASQMGMPWSQKYVAKGKYGPELTQSNYLLHISAESFKGKKVVGTGRILLPMIGSRTFPLSSEAMYQLKKESVASRKPLASLISVGSDGGYLVLGEPNCYTTDDTATMGATLVCSFKSTEQQIAPARRVTSTNPLAK